jgi:hypothetical protein
MRFKMKRVTAIAPKYEKIDERTMEVIREAKHNNRIIIFFL